MGAKAIIGVGSKQQGNENDAIEIVSQGDFYKKENCYYAVYEETELSGMAGTTTTIKIKPKELCLIRMGTTNAKVKFKENEKNISMYNTPHGTLELWIETKKLNINADDKGAEILVNYYMSLAGQKPLKTELNIKIKTL